MAHPQRLKRPCRFVVIAALAAVAATAQPNARAQSSSIHDRAWRWNAKFTPASDAALAAVHFRMMESGLGTSAECVPVENLTFKAPRFEVHLVSGNLWTEEAIDGYPGGAWFEGTARIVFDPPQRKARADLRNYFGAESLQDLPVTWLYLFTLRGGLPVARQIGAAPARSDPTPSPSGAYSLAKATMRQAGLSLLLPFLNREGRSKDAVWVLFSPDSLRSAGNGDAALLYSYDPARERPVELAVFGHRAAFLDPRIKHFLDTFPEYKYTFVPVAWVRREPNRSWVPPIDVEKYIVSMKFSPLLGETAEEAVVKFTPAEGVAAIRLSLTNRLAVSSVVGPNGEPYPFVQWGFLNELPNFDQTLLIRLPSPLPAGTPSSLTVVSKGPLFDPSSFSDALAVEDTWYPSSEDLDGALFETSGTTVKGMRFVAAGKEVSDEVVKNERTVRYATSRPAFGSSFYAGGYDVREMQADGGTRVQVFIERGTGRVKGSSDVEYAAQEIANAVGTFNKILDAPLETETLRAVTTPTMHGRGFEGLLLLSAYGALSNQSLGDVFRAHEVAHQWWGNMVQTDAWPEDRWLSEATAEYLAMEFYQNRFKKPEKTREQMRDHWVTPLRMATPTTVVNLGGQEHRIDASEIFALTDGSENVYTKGPLVLHQLRYLFRVMQKNEDGFWILLQDFLAKNKYKRAGTADFIEMAEQQIGRKIGWFWDQWLYGTKIPTVSWSHEAVKTADGKGWRLEVRGTQEDTSYQLAIPVYVTLKDGRTMNFPLLFTGKDGKGTALMKDKPAKVSLNDNYEALVWLKN